MGSRPPSSLLVTRDRAWNAVRCVPTARPALLVFDNPATGATWVIITTRNRAFLRTRRSRGVHPRAGSRFLHERTGPHDPGGAAELATDLGHLPLALSQAAAVIARLRLDYPTYLELLRDLPIGDHLLAQAGNASSAMPLSRSDFQTIQSSSCWRATTIGSIMEN
ncbi:hypothetical protein ACWEPC_43075 [Nonomuraea sp. NPDC004297]